LLITLGLLTKITAGCLLAVWPVLAWTSIAKGRTRSATLLIAASCIPALWWYAFWVPYLVEEYGYWHFFMGKSIVLGAQELLANLPQTLDNFYFDALRYTGFFAFLYGLYVVWEKRSKAILIASVLISGAFLLTMLK